jgi:integrase
MREAGPGPYADRLRGLIAILWRAGLRISEALALTESDLESKTGSGRGTRTNVGFRVRVDVVEAPYSKCRRDHPLGRRSQCRHGDQHGGHEGGDCCDGGGDAFAVVLHFAFFPDGGWGDAPTATGSPSVF